MSSNSVAMVVFATAPDHLGDGFQRRSAIANHSPLAMKLRAIGIARSVLVLGQCGPSGNPS